MHGFLDELHQAFLTLDFGQGPLDFLLDTDLEISYRQRSVRLLVNPDW